MIPATVMLATRTACGARSAASKVAATRRAHRLSGDLRGDDRADDIHVIRLPQVSDLAFQQPVWRGQHGVVHHQARCAACGVDRADDGPESRWVAGICGDAVCDRSGGLKFADQFCQPADITGQQRHAVAALRKSSGDSGAKARTRANDEQVLAVDTLGVGVIGAGQGRPS